MKKWILIVLAALLLSGCAPGEERPAAGVSALPKLHFSAAPAPLPQISLPTRAEYLASRMTLEEQVAQMLLVRCPASEQTQIIKAYQFGGLVLFARDVQGQTPESLTQTLAGYQAVSKIPMVISVDEEGGTVTRISSNKAFRDRKFPSPRSVYATSGMEGLVQMETEKAELLSGLGINVNLAPVCDIADDPRGFLYDRSLGLDPETTGACVAAMVDAMQDRGVGAVLKHFPGYGNCADTHVATVVDSRSLETFRNRDFIPFSAGFEAGAGGVMVSHTLVPALDPELPCSLSPAVHELLRRELQFEGVIITDDLAMEAVAGVYGEGEAAVLAVIAGNDLLCTSGYERQHSAILEAVRDGRISEERIRESVIRILNWKIGLGIL